KLNSLGVQGVLECEQESGRKHTLCELWADACFSSAGTDQNGFRTRPLYKPAYPSSLMTRRIACVMPSFSPLPATCIWLFTVIYGYVTEVAKSLPMAPRKKAMVGVTFRRFSTEFFSCSNSVYCRMGLMTRTNAGTTPANRARGPSSWSSLKK